MKLWKRPSVPGSLKLPATASLPIDTELERRRDIARRILVEDGGNVDKVQRRLILENPDTFVKPEFINEIPIG